MLRSGWFIGAVLIVACSGRGEAQGSAPVRAAVRQSAARFAGCYRLSDSVVSYEVRLDTVRSGDRWNAERIRPLTPNRGGDWW